MTRIVLTADSTQMSEYWGIPLLPFFSCAPAEKVPRFVFDFLAPSVRHFDGVAEKAPYGLRKLESSLRSEEHTSELQSLTNLVCRLLLVRHLPSTTLFPYTTLFRSCSYCRFDSDERVLGHTTTPLLQLRSRREGSPVRL